MIVIFKTKEVLCPFRYYLDNSGEYLKNSRTIRTPEEAFVSLYKTGEDI